MTTLAHTARTRPWSLPLQGWAPGLVPALLVALYVVLMPSTNLLPDVSPYNTKRLFQIALLVGVGGWLVVSSRARADWLQTFDTLPRAARLGLLGITGLGIVSSALAPLPRYAFLEVGHFVLLFVLIVALAAFYRRAPETAEKVFLWSIILAAAVYVARFYVDYLLTLTGQQYAFHVAPGSVWPRGELRTFVHVRFFNQFQTWTLPLIVLPALLYAARGPLVRRAYTALAMVWWMLLWASGGRGTIVAVLGALLVAGLVFGKRAWPWLKVQGIALAGGGALYGLLFKVVYGTSGSVMERDLTTTNGRFGFWERGWDMVQADPLLGGGPMQYAHHMHTWAAHPHNAVVQWAAEWGLPAAVLAVGLVAWGLVYALLRFRREAAETEAPSYSTAVRIAVVASLLAATAHALLSGILVMPLSQVLLALVVAWCWGLCVAKSHASRPQAVPVYRSALLVALVLASVTVLAWSVRQDTYAYRETETTTHELGKIEWRPRYWVQGYIATQAYDLDKARGAGRSSP